MKTSSVCAVLITLTAALFIACSSGGEGTLSLTIPISPTSRMDVFSTEGYNSYLYLPQGYSDDSVTKWPVIVYLHGFSEAGIYKGGLPELIESGRTYPFIILMPQSIANWKSSESLDAMYVHILALKDSCAADPGRIFLTGFSMGGDGTWALAAAHPELFAAIAPVGSFGLSGSADALQNMPVWIFHGDSDTVVPVSNAQTMYGMLSAYGRITLTIFPNADHQESKNRAYQNQELYDWFLSISQN